MNKDFGNIATDRLKGVLITRTAIKTLVAEDIVEQIISFQFKDVKELVRSYNEVEISGFGKFLVSAAKLRKKIAKLNLVIASIEKKLEEEEKQGGIPLKKKEYWLDHIEKLKGILEFLNTKKDPRHED